VLEARSLPFRDVTPSTEAVQSEAELAVVTPENISTEQASVANLVDFNRPKDIGVPIEIPAGSTPADVARLIELFQFPVPQTNGEARKRLIAIGLPAVPALIDALSSWDNKTYNQSIAVLERIGAPARPGIGPPHHGPLDGLELETSAPAARNAKVLYPVRYHGQDFLVPDCAAGPYGPQRPFVSPRAEENFAFERAEDDIVQRNTQKWIEFQFARHRAVSASLSARSRLKPPAAPPPLDRADESAFWEATRSVESVPSLTRRRRVEQWSTGRPARATR
jgi:hypothetical protein